MAYYEYNLRFQDESRNLLEEAKRDGLVEVSPSRRNGHVVIKMNLEAICAEEFPNGYSLEQKEGDEKVMNPEFFVYNEDITDNSIYYLNNHLADERLATAFSKHYPDAIIEEEREITPGLEKSLFYRKNGEFCDRNGNKVYGMITNVNRNLLKEVGDDSYKVSVPFLDEDTGETKWGIFYVKKSAVSYFSSFSDSEEDCERDGKKPGATVMITQERPTVYFRNGKVRMGVDDIMAGYYQSISNYAEKASRIVVIENYPKDRLVTKEDQRMGGEYLIVEVQCPTDISIDGKLTFAASIYGFCEIQDGAGDKVDLAIGEAFRSKNVYVLGPGGRKSKMEMKCFEIEKLWEEERSREPSFLEEASDTMEEDEEREL